MQKTIYHQQKTFCNKENCRRCREGIGHGPYWYSYQTIEGRTRRTYVGKHLPPEAQAAMRGTKPASTIQETERELPMLRIYALGQFRLERRNPRDPLEWQTVTEVAWQHKHVRALLGCLVSVSGRKLTREQIMDALWPHLEMEMAVSHLDRSVSSLRQLFEPGRKRFATSPLLLTEHEVLVLADHQQIWIDANVFENLINRANKSKDSGEKERLLCEASSLYGGPFLPEDSRNEWTRVRREMLQRSWIGLLLELADLQITREAYTAAIDSLDKLLSIDPTNDAAVQRLMSLLAQLGRRGEALRAYKRLHTVLQQEYRITPLPETRAIYDNLRAGREQMGKGTIQQAETANRDTTTRTGGSGEVASVQIGRAHQSPLVGREQELEHLTSLVKVTEQAAKFRLTAQKRVSAATLDPNRRPQCILLMGDVGIGKTRLAEEMGREAQRRGWTVAWSRVYAQEGAIPYRLWIEVLRKAMTQGVWQRQEINKRPIIFQSLSNLLPELQEMMTQVTYTTSHFPEQEQLRLWEAVKELLILISESTPLLIALDDLQWADRSSCELLAYLARRTHGYPIVIVCTCRDMELPQDHPLRPLLTDLRRESAVESISLEPLRPDQIASLVTQVTQVPEPMAQRISNRAAGNPFFAEELARTIETEPIMTDNRLSEERNPLPDTISAVLTLRMGRLSLECQRLLSKAAVLGSSFEFQVISAMEESGANNNEDAILELIEEGLKSGMLTEEGIGTRVTYSFWHPLLASHLYESLSAARRASQHRRAAEVFKQLYAGNEEKGAATITHHLIQGGSSPQHIAHYAQRAGDYAFSLSSYPEAEKYYRITLEHQGKNTADWQQPSSLLEHLAECARIQGKTKEAIHFYEQSLDIRMHENTDDDSSAPSSQEAQRQAMIWCQVALAQLSLGELVRARQATERGEQVLRDTNISEGPTWAHLKLRQGFIYWREGNLDLALQSATEAYEVFSQEQSAKDQIDLGKALNLMSSVKVAQGYSWEGLNYLKKALAIFERYDCAREIAIVYCNIGDIYLRTGDYDDAQMAFKHCLETNERVGDQPLTSFIIANLGILALRQGDLLVAEAQFRQAVEIATLLKDTIYLSWWMSMLALALVEQGKLAEAKSILLQALALARKAGAAPFIGYACMVVGRWRILYAQSPSIASQRERQLLRAKKMLQRALTFDGLEADTIIETRLLIAQACLGLGDRTSAREQALLAHADSRRFRFRWHQQRSQVVLGMIDTTATISF